MNKPRDVNVARATAEQFVESNLVDLCRELVEFDETGLFGTGKAHHLRNLCIFAGHAAQSLAINLVQSAALRVIANGSYKAG